MMFDYTRTMDKSTPDRNVPGKNAPNIQPQQWYHTRLFLGNHISREMELFFRDTYKQYGDFHIVDLSVLNGNQVLLVYSIPCYR